MTEARALLLAKLAEARAKRGETPRHQPTFRVAAGPGRVHCFACGRDVTADELFDEVCAAGISEAKPRPT